MGHQAAEAAVSLETGQVKLNPLLRTALNTPEHLNTGNSVAGQRIKGAMRSARRSTRLMIIGAVLGMALGNAGQALVKLLKERERNDKVMTK